MEYAYLENVIIQIVFFCNFIIGSWWESHKFPHKSVHKYQCVKDY